MSHNDQNVDKNIHVNNLNELLDLTDTDDSTSSSDTQIFERNNAFVLELHELKRDELPDNPLPEVKTRKLLKKKKRGQLPATDHSGSSLPSSSPSESSVAPAGPEDAAKEEFYDAHESYHALPENQASAAVASAGVMQVISEHNAPKASTQAQPPAQPAATARQPSTTITKPVTPPE